MIKINIIDGVGGGGAWPGGKGSRSLINKIDVDQQFNNIPYILQMSNNFKGEPLP